MQVKILTKNIVVNRKGEILALKRSGTDVRRPNAWDFPGGGLDQGEDIYDSARREIEEEAGLAAEDLQVIYVESGVGIIDDSDVLALCFVCRDWHGEVMLSPEHDEFAWVTPEEYLELETGDDGGFLHQCVRTWLNLYPTIS